MGHRLARDTAPDWEPEPEIEELTLSFRDLHIHTTNNLGAASSSTTAFSSLSGGASVLAPAGVVASSSGAAPPITTASLPAAQRRASDAPLRGEGPLWARRLARARRAGEQALQVLQGDRPRIAASDRLPGIPPSNFYVVLRGRAGLEREVRGIFFTWESVAPAVLIPGTNRICDRAIFHGFPSLDESEAYWVSAGFALPPRRYLIYR